MQTFSRQLVNNLFTLLMIIYLIGGGFLVVYSQKIITKTSRDIRIPSISENDSRAYQKIVTKITRDGEITNTIYLTAHGNIVNFKLEVEKLILSCKCNKRLDRDQIYKIDKLYSIAQNEYSRWLKEVEANLIKSKGFKVSHYARPAERNIISLIDYIYETTNEKPKKKISIVFIDSQIWDDNYKIKKAIKSGSVHLEDTSHTITTINSGIILQQFISEFKEISLNNDIIFNNTEWKDWSKLECPAKTASEKKEISDYNDETLYEIQKYSDLLLQQKSIPSADRALQSIKQNARVLQQIGADTGFSNMSAEFSRELEIHAEALKQISENKIAEKDSIQIIDAISKDMEVKRINFDKCPSSGDIKIRIQIIKEDKPDSGYQIFYRLNNPFDTQKRFGSTGSTIEDSLPPGNYMFQLEKDGTKIKEQGPFKVSGCTASGQAVPQPNEIQLIIPKS